MALIGLLITAMIVVLYFVFFHAGSTDKPQIQPKNIEQNAQDAVNKTILNKKLELDQVNNVDEP